ncbi:MAG: CocE/NonD family hydrolase, partial [Thermoanaerobaculia bacterium]|nr:CocE/NonD family hydrolase [Thermoanaerobaculia bacterium]
MIPTTRLTCLWLSLLTILGAFAVAAAEDAADPRSQEHMVPMRDGVRLATTVYVPDGEGPWPAIVARTPYDRKRGGPAQARP